MQVRACAYRREKCIVVTHLNSAAVLSAMADVHVNPIVVY